MSRPRNLRGERGAALPLAILAIAMISLAAIAGLQRLAAERHINANLEAESDAYALAVAGSSSWAVSFVVVRVSVVE